MMEATGRYILAYESWCDVFIILDEEFTDEIDPLEVTAICEVVEDIMADVTLENINDAEQRDDIYNALYDAMYGLEGAKCLQCGFQVIIA